MKSRPGDVEDDTISAAIADGWGLQLDQLSYLPVGGGAYHWSARTTDGRRLFVTCDDLDTKPWLGNDADTVFANLLAAYGTAIDLRRAGAVFIVAPLPSVAGNAAERIDERHSVAVFDHVDGDPGQWGRRLPEADLHELVAMLATLHQSEPSGRVLPHRGVDVPGRADLDEALGNLDHPWDAGPLSEAARGEVAANVVAVAEWLEDLNRLAKDIAGDGARDVITHGEPHPGNLIRTPTGLALVDWDTVALARPERDLWMLADVDPDLLVTYEQLTGTTLDRDALRAFRLLWATADVAAFVHQLRSPHDDSEDSRWALASLRSIFERREPRPYGAWNAR